MILYNDIPGTLLLDDANTTIHESFCVTLFTEDELKNVISNPLVIIPSRSSVEVLQLLEVLIKFDNTGDLLLEGSALSVNIGLEVVSPPIPALTFLGEDASELFPSIPPLVDPTGVPVTINSVGATEFTGGSGLSTLRVIALYRRTYNK